MTREEAEKEAQRLWGKFGGVWMSYETPQYHVGIITRAVLEKGAGNSWEEAFKNAN